MKDISQNLIEIQLNSFKRLQENGWLELFEEFFPIMDPAGRGLELHFVNCRFEEPKYSQEEAFYKEQNFEVPLRVKLKLINKITKSALTQEIYFGDFPLMTERGTFIINGVERVIVSQLIRSAGVYFNTNLIKGRKLFGAKVIPSRGSWLEIESELDGSIWVKIDRKRKVPITNLLRVFADFKKENLEKNEDIIKIFGKEILPTLNKDQSSSIENSFIEIYRRLRPGDLATPDNAKSLIEPMFTSFERYNLSPAGRYKINQRLGIKSQGLLLTLEDLIKIIKEIIRLNNELLSEPDNIDHLGNRRIKTVGELLQDRLRIGFAHLKRGVRDKMSTLDPKIIKPVHLINPKLLVLRAKEFFTLSQLSQFMAQTNPLAGLEHKRLLSVLGPGGLSRERAGFEVRDVHYSYYGRICPIQTPEGPNIGLVSALANFASLNELGFLQTPYFKVKNGKVGSEMVWLDAYEDEEHIIASFEAELDRHRKIIEQRVKARHSGTIGIFKRNEIEYIDVCFNQPFSVAASLIPFLEHDDANRALMGSNMQKQAVPLINPEQPLVQTGLEEKIAKDSQEIILAPEQGEITRADAQTIELKTAKRKIELKLKKFRRTNQFTCFSQRTIVKKNQKVKKGEILTDGTSIEKGVLSLGQNLLVAFLSFEGNNFEDAVVLSEKVVRDDRFSSIYIEDFYCDVRDTKLGPELTTPDIPNVSEDKLANLDEDGIVRIGTEIKEGDILVGRISPKGEVNLSSEERLLRAIFGEEAKEIKDNSLTVPHGKRGRVIDIKISSREKGDYLDPGVIKRIRVRIAQLRNIQAGDKMTGRHGNKGVVSQIRPVEDMPYLEDGTPVDVVLNPLSMISRMNLGQILEAHLGWAAKKLGRPFIVPPFSDFSWEKIKQELTKADLPCSGKTTLYDGRTGQVFKQKVVVGCIYMMKLNHLVEDKIHMRSTGPYSLITQQPLGGKARLGGQRFGEMEVWALEGYGAAHSLQEMLTVKSDDIIGRSAVFEAIIKGEEIKKPNIPTAFNVLASELRSLCLNIKVERDIKEKNVIKSISLKLASPEDILSWSKGEVIKAETINYRTQRPEKDGLFSERIFGPTKDFECYCGKYKKPRYKGIICDRCGVEITRSIVRRERMGHIKLASPVSHIWFLKSVPSRLSLILNTSLPKLEKVIYYANYIVVFVDKKNKKEALLNFEKKVKQLTDEEKKEIKEKLSSLNVGVVLTQREYTDFKKYFSNVFRAGLGAEAIREILEKINLSALALELEKKLAQTKDLSQRDKITRRYNLIKNLIKSKIKPEWMILTTLPVLPPDLRPMVALDGGRFATSDLNDFYRRVINRNNRLKKLIELKAPKTIIINEKRMLQEAVDSLIDNSAAGARQQTNQHRPLKSLTDVLKGKQGRFRQNLLGKRVDYSARSVIVIGPNLSIGECGLPKKIALELVRPYVINKLIEKGSAYNIKMANQIINQETAEVWAILEEVIKNKKVLLNRAPTLHRLGIQAFQPLLIEDLAIKIPAMTCVAFNADFDGDQMAVHLPLTKQAQDEASNIMLSSKNLLKPANGQAIATPTQDIVLGCYFLTILNDLTEEEKNKSKEEKIYLGLKEAELSFENDLIDFSTPIKVLVSQKGKEKIITTSYGRMIFNEQMPEEIDFVNEPLNKKLLSVFTDLIIEKVGIDKASFYLNKIKELGFEYATQSGISCGADDLIIPKEKEGLIKKAQDEIKIIEEHFDQGMLTANERKYKIERVWMKTIDSMHQLVKNAFPSNNPVSIIVNSEARGTWSQQLQMVGMKGLVQGPKGDIIEVPVISSYKEGYDVLEYFISTHGARKGTTDTALKTASAGYLTRRLIDVAQDLTIKEKDCGTKEGIEILRKDGEEYGYGFAERIFSRTALKDIVSKKKVIVKEGEIIDKAKAKTVEKIKTIKSVKVRSPITCKTAYGICSKCYGLDLGNNQPIKIGEAVGIVAAQSIGEPGTQLTLRTFHIGGVAGLDITHGLPRIQELVENRSLKSKAVLSEVEGKVFDIEEKGTRKIVKIEISGDKKKLIEYSIPRQSWLRVSKGEKVYKGQQINEGSIELKKILALKGIKEVQRYIINEIQKIYVPEGAYINDKHIEIIVRQMFSCFLIKKAGDTDFIIGDIVEKSSFLEANKNVRKLKGEPAKAEQLIMGITRASLNTESFLSAASFQETQKVLTTAALSAKVDYLRGLKENVIIGYLIPAGSGQEKKLT